MLRIKASAIGMAKAFRFFLLMLLFLLLRAISECKLFIRSSFQVGLQTPVEFGENSETQVAQSGKYENILAGLELMPPAAFISLSASFFSGSTRWTTERKETSSWFETLSHLQNSISAVKRSKKRKPTVNWLKLFFVSFLCFSSTPNRIIMRTFSLTMQ